MQRPRLCQQQGDQKNWCELGRHLDGPGDGWHGGFLAHIWEVEQSAPHLQVLWRGNALSTHSSVALSTGRLLASHSNLSLALSKVNKPYSQGASDCSSCVQSKRRVEIFVYNRKTDLLLLPLPWSKHLPLADFPVFLCIKGLASWVRWSSWHKNLKRSDLT